ncbi:MAG: PEP/pyruvate-binding domain-containing protein [Ignavibacteriaceae bacterium]|nr:PEP/pyruvate-binding domain-containing protein [Ignavibacteriaceae bacterium]
MDKLSQLNIENLVVNRLDNFQKLMRYKTREILLVSSLYDNYLFEEDGRLYELVREEYRILNLSQAPEITHVTTGEEALELFDEITFDMIITTMHIEDMHVIKLAQKIKAKGINTPIILLAYDNKERKELTSNYDISIFDRIFIWQGDYKLLIAITKYSEDKLNADNDILSAGVQAIILVEDNIKFYSSYLPIIYTEIFNQSLRLISEGVNLTHKFMRMRARPKILLSTNYEEAWNYFEKYQESVLGIITDMNFKKDGVKDPQAGLKFALAVKEKHKDIPILIQSSNPDFDAIAREIGASFIQKNSPRLLHQLREFMMNRFGFGDFIFRTPDGIEVGRASNLISLEEQLRIVPDESIHYHAERNHFSNWLKARTEFWLAYRLRPRKVTDFQSVEGLRQELISSLKLYQTIRQRGVITDFNKELFDPVNSFARMGGGSLGGKARGLGFINTLINNYNVRNKFEEVEITVPSAIVIATDVFDQFIEKNHLENITLTELDDKIIIKVFLEAEFFPFDILKKLLGYLEIVKDPIAVRSSSLLEDSQFQPFAGVYETYMIPNNNPDINIRLQELLECIKCVYASTFCKAARDYMKVTSYRLEEEKMAVIIQQLVGASHEERFYPDFAGVAKSFNFYPVPPQKSSDGIALVALGLGKTVVDGGNCVRFCPKYPRHLLQFFSTKETIKNAQQHFYALNLNGKLKHTSDDNPEELVVKHELTISEKDQTLNLVGSTYSTENDSVYDGISRKGNRVVTFAPVLKHNAFPLAEILDLLLELGTWGMGAPIEIEFAVNMNVPPGKPKEFAMLQMRPLVISRELEELDVDNSDKEDLICQSNQVLGNGAINDLYDIVMVDIQKFDRGKSREVALEISQLNSELFALKKPYILIGVGRWGSLDHWLGIPVTWDQISGASVIVESGFKDLNVTPSQGSHFFQNITSFKVGYFSVNALDNLGFIDWDWLTLQPAVHELNYARHLTFDKPLSVRINGQQNKGIILKPGR